MVSKHHVYHAIHHNFTTKKPHSAHRFPQKPLQKHPFTIAKKIYGTYFAGLGFAGDSESQKMFTERGSATYQEIYTPFLIHCVLSICCTIKSATSAREMRLPLGGRASPSMR